MLRKELQQIFNDFKLKYLDDNGNELPFVTVLEQIYFDWNSDNFRQFMNAIVAIEVNGGGNPFEKVEY